MRKIKGRHLTARFNYIVILPALALNLLFIAQAIVFNWQLGTLVWVYWMEGFVLAILGQLNNKKSIVWTMLLLLLAFYLIFLAGLTFPSDYMSYTINGAEVEPSEFTVLSNTNWKIVFINVGMLLAGYVYASIFTKDKSAFSGKHVAKRLIPLHVTIALAVSLPWSVVIFAVLRSAFDLIAESDFSDQQIRR